METTVSCLGKMGDRKEKGVLYFLYVQGLNSVTTNHHPVRKRQNSLVLLLNWLNLAAFLQSYTWNTTEERQGGFKRSQKDSEELLKYIIYKK